MHIVRGDRRVRSRREAAAVARALHHWAKTGPPAAPISAGGRRRSWPLAVPVAALAAAALRRRWVAEDAFINFRVVAVTRRGRQPFAFNPGERVEAGTSPLWVAALVGLDAALGRFVALERLSLGAGLGLSVLGLAAATAASARLLR